MRIRFVFLVMFFCIFACSEQQAQDTVQQGSKTVQEDEFTPIIDTILVDSVVIALQIRDTALANVLLLPGWNYSIDHWNDSTLVEKLAEKHGFNLIMPNMMRSIYSDSIYVETRSDWEKEKTSTWLYDTLIPQIQERYNILKSDQLNFVIGISTGGRGAVKSLISGSELFDGGVSLSGDYDIVNSPNDNLNRGFYGSIERQDIRWIREDLQLRAFQINAPILLIHGNNDKVVPVKHSLNLAEALRKSDKRYELIIDSIGGHDYNFWNKYLPKSFEFIDSIVPDKND
jgi:S-formylglutathione hydrolase FrmB